MHDEIDNGTGYGKPPKHSQFQKGVSGNPKGRPKGSKNVSTLFRKIIHEKVRVNGPRGPRWISKLEASLTQLVNQAATGDPKAIRELIHWTKVFGDAAPNTPAPVFNIRFLSAKKNQPGGEGSENQK